jgi:hypothetical protein
VGQRYAHRADLNAEPLDVRVSPLPAYVLEVRGDVVGYRPTRRRAAK